MGMKKKGFGIDRNIEEQLKSGGRRGREHKTSMGIDLDCGNPVDRRLTSICVYFGYVLNAKSVILWVGLINK